MPTATATAAAVRADDGPDLSDEDIINGVRGGDAGAFAELYRRHFAAALRAAARVSCPGAAADDLVSEAFARVFTLMLAGGGPDRSFRTYVCTAVRNAARQRARSDWRLDFPGDDRLDCGMTLVASAESDAVRTMTAETVRAAVATLPQRSRSALWLMYAEDRPAAEVADSLSVSVTALTSLAFRARGRMRALLGQFAPAA